MCDKQGKKVAKAKMTEVTVLPQGIFNLFSISRMQGEGWILGGDKEAVWITKGKSKLTFDIVVKTPKGRVYAAYMRDRDCRCNSR